MPPSSSSPLPLSTPLSTGLLVTSSIESWGRHSGKTHKSRSHRYHTYMYVVGHLCGIYNENVLMSAEISFCATHLEHFLLEKEKMILILQHFDFLRGSIHKSHFCAVMAPPSYHALSRIDTPPSCGIFF